MHTNTYHANLFPLYFNLFYLFKRRHIRKEIKHNYIFIVYIGTFYLFYKYYQLYKYHNFYIINFQIFNLISYYIIINTIIFNKYLHLKIIF